MKIAIVTPPLTVSWWWHRQAIELAISLSENWHEVHVFTRYLDRARCFPDKLPLLNLHYLVEWSEPFWFSNVKWIFQKTFLAIRKFFMNSSDAKRLAGLIKFIESEEGVFDVVNLHDVEIDVAPYFEARKVVWIMNDVPWIHWNPSEFLKDKWFSFRLLFKAYNFFLLFRLRHYCKRVAKICVLDNRNRLLVKSMLDIDAMVVRSWIDLNKFSTSIRKWWNQDEKVKILCTWILFRHRKFEDVIRAAWILVRRWVINFKINIIWKTDLDPVYYDELLSLVNSLNLDSFVDFLGPVSESNLLAEYSSSEIFVFPNSPQTWWLAVFEAMLSGCLVFLTRWCGASEVLTNQENCLIFESWNPDSLAKLIESSINNPDASKSIANSWTLFVTSNLSWHKFWNDMLNVFCS